MYYDSEVVLFKGHFPANPISDYAPQRVLKTIKPLESNLEDLRFPEFPGKAEPGWRRRTKKQKNMRFTQKQASVKKHSKTMQKMFVLK